MKRVGGKLPPFELMFGSLRLLTATWRKPPSRRASFAATCSSGSNVFPIGVRPLRERPEDIPMLVEYFIDRYARKAGKSFQWVNKKSLDLLQSYPWPGNIRELQNVIERSVIVCETENFSVDESWLSRRPPAIRPDRRSDLFKRFPSREKAIIEAALSETLGRVYGPSVPPQPNSVYRTRSTLEVEDSVTEDRQESLQNWRDPAKIA